MAIFFLFELYKFIMTIVEIKRPKLTEDDEEEIKKRAIEEYLASQKAPEENVPESSDTKKDTDSDNKAGSDTEAAAKEDTPEKTEE